MSKRKTIQIFLPDETEIHVSLINIDTKKALDLLLGDQNFNDEQIFNENGYALTSLELNTITDYLHELHDEARKEAFNG